MLTSRSEDCPWALFHVEKDSSARRCWEEDTDGSDHQLSLSAVPGVPASCGRAPRGADVISIPEPNGSRSSRHCWRLPGTR